MAGIFNDYFEFVFTWDDDITSQLYESSNKPPLADIIISQDGDLSLLLNLPVKKSAGPDEIPSSFLKTYSEWCSTL